MTEADGDIAKAADILQELQVKRERRGVEFSGWLNALSSLTGWDIWFNGERREGYVCHRTDEAVPSKEGLHQSSDNQ